MKNLFTALKSIFSIAVLASCATSKIEGNPTTGATLASDSREIIMETPKRPEGQQDMIGFAAPKIANVRVGFIGLGMRGPGAVERFTHIPGTEVVALCDIRPERVEAA